MTKTDVKNKSHVILALLFAPDATGPASPIEGITRLGKLAFLTAKETGILSLLPKDEQFSFKPYKMGPFSEKIYDELDFLQSLDLVEGTGSTQKDATEAVEDRLFFDDQMLDKYQKGEFRSEGAVRRYHLTERGRQVAKSIFDSLLPSEKEYIKNLKAKFNHISLKQLLQYVYKKYPEYTTKSEIKEYLGL